MLRTKFGDMNITVMIGMANAMLHVALDAERSLFCSIEEGIANNASRAGMTDMNTIKPYAMVNPAMSS